jgi:hypothetical protein
MRRLAALLPVLLIAACTSSGPTKPEPADTAGFHTRAQAVAAAWATASIASPPPIEPLNSPRTTR